MPENAEEIIEAVRTEHDKQLDNNIRFGKDTVHAPLPDLISGLQKLDKLTSSVLKGESLELNGQVLYSNTDEAKMAVLSLVAMMAKDKLRQLDATIKGLQNNIERAKVIQKDIRVKFQHFLGEDKPSARVLELSNLKEKE